MDDDRTIRIDFLGDHEVACGPWNVTGTFPDSTGLWCSPNLGATNTAGFTALPGGSRNSSVGEKETVSARAAKKRGEEVKKRRSEDGRGSLASSLEAISK